MCIRDRVVYITADCNEDAHPDIFFLYQNFVTALLAKLGVLNFAFLEVSGNGLFNTRVPLLVPLLGFGALPTLQTPQLTFDTANCRSKNSIFSWKIATVLNQLCGWTTIVALLIFTVFTLIATRFKSPSPALKKSRGIFFVLGIAAVFGLNAIFIVLALGQTGNFDTLLLVDGIIYAGFVVLALVAALLRRSGVELFQRGEPIETHPLTAAQHYDPMTSHHFQLPDHSARHTDRAFPDIIIESPQPRSNAIRFTSSSPPFADSIDERV
eukprot:TRINITY_DN8295_c0_g1_i3.p1 TRINITY_DN8295_c0_g1~~TRINITY_DN8295_c0_g1_i3.p1  ORF type:complete len:288 (+),score=36.05 TRINITY_DN8295_c0_g1_i3:61-864(+)